MILSQQMAIAQTGRIVRPSLGAELASSGNGSTSDLSQSNRRWVCRAAAGSTWHKARCATSRGSADGSFYFEVLVLNIGSGNAFAVGIADAGTVTTSGQGGTANAGDGSRRQYFNDGRKRAAGAYLSYGATYAAGDVIGISVTKSGTSITLTAYKNGVSQGVMYSFTSSASFDPHFCTYANDGALLWVTDMQYLPQGFIPWV